HRLEGIGIDFHVAPLLDAGKELRAKPLEFAAVDLVGLYAVAGCADLHAGRESDVELQLFAVCLRGRQ
ncbi:MAG TPA: hypothetical protein VGA56_06605, partial [Opitutaceae bacterium]